MMHSNLPENDSLPAPPFRSQLRPILFLAPIFYVNMLSRVIFAPLMPTIEQELHISHGVAGSLFLLIWLGYFPSMIGSAFLSSRLNHHKAISISSTALGFVLLGMSFCNSLWSICAGVFLVGLSSGLYLPSGITALTSAINPKHWGKAIGIHELGPTLGFLTAPLISEAFLNLASWRGVLILLGAAALLLGAAFFRFGKAGKFSGEAPKLDSVRQLLRVRGFWLMAFFFGLGITGTLGVYTMLPLYLIVEKEFEQNWANWLISISRAACPAVVFLAGWVADVLGTKKTMFIVFLLAGLATAFLGITQGPWLVAFVLLQPLLTSSFFPAGFAAISKVIPVNLRNLGVAFTVSLAFIIGGGLVPTMIGLAGDLASFAVGITATGILILSGAVLCRRLVYAE